jgi:hypothetical protein
MIARQDGAGEEEAGSVERIARAKSKWLIADEEKADFVEM